MGSYGRLWRGRLGLIRPANGLMAALGVLVGLVAVAPGPLTASTWAAAPLAAFLVTSAGNAFNDVGDRELDRKAHPDRPLPSGALGVREAKAFAVVLLAFGLWNAWLAAGPPTLAFAAANALALWLYEARLKAWGLTGNVLVALLVASTFAFGAAATGVAPAGWGLLWLLVAMAFLTNLARELLKDLEDAAADRGRRATLPLQVGAGPTRLLAFLLVNGAVLLSLLAFRSTPESWWPWWLVPLAASDLLFLVGATLAWVRLGAAQRFLKAAMAVALLAFLAGPGLHPVAEALFGAAAE